MSAISEIKGPAKTKLGRNWYQSTGITLVLGRWTFIFYFKGTPSWILPKKPFAAT
jgi:hypothetical protein